MVKPEKPDRWRRRTSASPALRGRGAGRDGAAREPGQLLGGLYRVLVSTSLGEMVALSPDGERIAFTRHERLYAFDLRSKEAMPFAVEDPHVVPKRDVRGPALRAVDEPHPSAPRHLTRGSDPI